MPKFRSFHGGRRANEQILTFNIQRHAIHPWGKDKGKGRSTPTSKRAQWASKGLCFDLEHAANHSLRSSIQLRMEEGQWFCAFLSDSEGLHCPWRLDMVGLACSQCEGSGPWPIKHFDGDRAIVFFTRPRSWVKETWPGVKPTRVIGNNFTWNVCLFTYLDQESCWN